MSGGKVASGSPVPTGVWLAPSEGPVGADGLVADVGVCLGRAEVGVGEAPAICVGELGGLAVAIKAMIPMTRSAPTTMPPARKYSSGDRPARTGGGGGGGGGPTGWNGAGHSELTRTIVPARASGPK